MKRFRAVDVPPKFRRTAKGRNTRLGNSVYFSSAYNLVYLKFFLMWVCCITLDFLIGFRFELLWPVWLLVRHLYESFRVHAFSSSLPYSAFSVFFVCVTATSDLVCYLFIPIQVLIFLASTYVWVQFVYQSSDRGVCLPSLFLWALFIVFEYSVRYRFDNATWYLTRTSWITAGLFPSTADSVSIGLSANSSSSSSPSSTRLELYRPFAAHCIGFPVVTLGFRVKSFFSNWRMRVRRQEVMRQNEFFERLLADAIPTSFENRKHFISSRSHLAFDQDVIDYDVNAYNTSDLLLNGFDANSINHQPRVYSVLNNSSSSQIAAICAAPSPSYCGASSSTSSITQQQQQYATSSLTTSAVTKKSQQAMKTSTKISSSALKQQQNGVLLNGFDVNNSSISQQPQQPHLYSELGAAICAVPSTSYSGANSSSSSITQQQQHYTASSLTTSAVTKKPQQSVKMSTKISSSSTPKQQQNGALIADNMDSECSLLRENAQRLSEIRQLQKERQTLEGSFDKIKAELKSARSSENDLRLQLNNAQQREQSCREEWKQFEREQKQRVDQLEGKCKQLGKQNDYYKLNTQALERRVGELQLKKSEIERELTNERLRNSARDDPVVKHYQSANDNGEFKQKLANQDRELKTLRKDLKSKTEQFAKCEDELRQLRTSNSDGSKQMEIMRQKNFELEQKLSSENKLKQDLFRALNDSKAEIASLKARLHSKQANMQEGVMNAFRDTTTSGTGSALFQSRNGCGGCNVGLNSSSGSSPTALQQQQQRQFSSISQQKSLTPPPLSVGSSTFNPTLEQLLQATQNMSYSLSPLDSNGGGTNGVEHGGGNAFNSNGMHNSSGSSPFIGVAASEMLAVGGHRSISSGNTNTGSTMRDGSNGN